MQTSRFPNKIKLELWKTFIRCLINYNIEGYIINTKHQNYKKM